MGKMVILNFYVAVLQTLDRGTKTCTHPQWLGGEPTFWVCYSDISYGRENSHKFDFIRYGNYVDIVFFVTHKRLLTLSTNINIQKSGLM